MTIAANCSIAAIAAASPWTSVYSVKSFRSQKSNVTSTAPGSRPSGRYCLGLAHGGLGEGVLDLVVVNPEQQWVGKRQQLD